MWSFLGWHAYEELEHKSVVFDLYRASGGLEWLRVGVFLPMSFGTVPGAAAGVLLSVLTDPGGWNPSGWKPRRVLRQIVELYRSPLVKGTMRDLGGCLRPSFHPDDIDTTELLGGWTDKLFGARGALADRAL
ncbi:hypothetical protein HMPREF9336_03158 [Segniliparus rugosus ATCC BAA-974]|uniref:Metal-dependent hydrolase n=1 Tax=Segniliparus rugosus (strain ATCC BAA-974 / DSM 45345 / CCUG 50838 / CIP 108380 / JCM 13579 / CDC 945) TaxID=679197 RepID=E5XUI6_SEGRC|nr:hypothetical protein HMPREF9336_03158 [Segniliparus rugosus ATCC BAA-974]